MKRIAMCLALGLVASLVTAGGAIAARAHTDVRCSGFGHIVLKYPNLYGYGQFRCPSGAKSATETIILQGYENGKWTNLKSASRTVHAAKYKTYPIKTPVITCSSTPRHENVRTIWRLDAGPLHLRTPPSDPFPTYCIGA